MAQNSLIGLVTGLFSSKVPTAGMYNDAPKVKKASDDLTGVARYLEAHKGRSSVSGVSKYLKKQEKATMSGVSKYLLRQSIVERNNKASTVSTGVEKYLKSRKVTPTVVRSGVAKYLDNLDKSSLSGVSKYVVKKNIADRSKPVQKTTRVAEYLENRKVNLTSGVSKYLTRQIIAEKQATAAKIESIVITLTGVEKYLQSHA